MAHSWYRTCSRTALPARFFTGALNGVMGAPTRAGARKGAMSTVKGNEIYESIFLKSDIKGG